MTAPDPSTAEFLRRIVFMLIPATPFSLTESRNGRMIILSLDIPPGSPRGIVMGKGGETLNSLRRLATVFAALHGETVTVFFNTEERKSPNVRSEVPVQ